METTYRIYYCQVQKPYEFDESSVRLSLGASKKALLLIYKSLIISVIDYGDVVYSTGNKSNLDKLSSVQTEALRLCCGAAKGTAALALQNEWGEMPLQVRRLQNSLKLGAKVLGTPHHTARSAYQPHWTNEFRTAGNKNESTYTLTHSFFSSLNLTFLAPTFSTTPPWLNKEIDIDISLHESISKRNDNPELLRLISLDHINRYNTYTHMYTDGSKAENFVAAFYTIPTLNLNKQFRLCNSSSIYANELTVIKEVFSWISENETQDLKNVALFSDSLSVLTSFKNSFSESRPPLLQETIQTFNEI